MNHKMREATAKPRPVGAVQPVHIELMKPTSQTVRSSGSRPGSSHGKSSQVILCATDFSVHAAQAARIAAFIAARLKTTLHLVHVLDGALLPKSSDRARKEWHSHARAQLVLEAARLEKTGCKVTSELLEGRPENELVRWAETHRPRLLVMASIGQIAIGRILAGSVAERTAEAAPVPTLIVREDSLMLDWLEGRRALQVFVAADFSASAEMAIQWISDLRKVGACELTVGYLDWPPEAKRRYGTKAHSGPLNNSPEIQRALERDLRERVQDLIGDTSAHIRVEAGWGAPEFNLMQMATEDHMDLFVVGTHQRHGWTRLFQPSVSRAVIHHAPMNVACIPARARLESSTIPEVRRVLVTTDLSPLANHAIATACSILPSGGLVRLVHVMPPYAPVSPLFANYDAGRMTRKAYSALASRITQQLESLIPESATLRGIRSEVAVIEGTEVSRAVAQESERMGADVICIGSHGRTGLVSLALGSVAQQLIGHSRKPVLVVRPPEA